MDLTNTMAILVLIIGALVFLVNIIVEVTKNILPIKTDFYVLGLSIILSVVSYFIYLGYTATTFVWYYLIAAIFVGFFVCYVAQNGWQKFIRLWEEAQKDHSNKEE